jgi:hypothetical protein
VKSYVKVFRLENSELDIKSYKPEVTNPQHTKVEIFQGKIKRKYLNLGLEFSFLTNCFRQSINKEKYCVTNYLNTGL